jgi:hypothetical protein
VADQAAQAVHGRRALTVTLIAVSGAPGTGKATIAAALGAGRDRTGSHGDPFGSKLTKVAAMIELMREYY